MLICNQDYNEENLTLRRLGQSSPPHLTRLRVMKLCIHTSV